MSRPTEPQATSPEIRTGTSQKKPWEKPPAIRPGHPHEPPEPHTQSGSGDPDPDQHHPGAPLV